MRVPLTHAPGITTALAEPGMATMAPDAMLIGISTPYRKSGLLYRKFRDHFGMDGDVVAIKAPSAQSDVGPIHH